MLRGYRGVFVAIAGLVIVLGSSLLLTWSLYPEQPNLSGNTGYEKELSGYHAGGADCEPSQIKRLGDGKRAERAKSCQEAQEQHRLQANDLIQQRRSADAADAMTILSYQQTRIGAWGVALGFITMAAAIAAAFYARSAAIHSDKSHNAFVNAERAIVRVVSAHQGSISGTNPRPVIAVTFKNVGRTATRITKFGSNTTGSAPRWLDIGPGCEETIAGPEIPTGINVILNGWFQIEYTLIGGGFGQSNFQIKGYWRPDDGLVGARWIFEVTNENGHPDDT